MATAVTTWCSLHSCPSMTITCLSHGILLGFSVKDNTFDASLQEWISIQRRVNASENLQTSLQVVYLVTQIQLFVMMVHSLCLGTILEWEVYHVYCCLLLFCFFCRFNKQKYKPGNQTSDHFAKNNTPSPECNTLAIIIFVFSTTKTPGSFMMD